MIYELRNRGVLSNNCPLLQKEGLSLNMFRASDLLTNKRRLLSFHLCAFYVKLNRKKCAMQWQLAELEYKAKRNSDWRVGGHASRPSQLRHNNQPGISGERHGREQWSTIVLKLMFGYLNCRPSNIVVK